MSVSVSVWERLREGGREEDVNSESPICGGDYSFVFSLQTQIRHLGFSTKIPSQVTQRLLGFPIRAKLKNNIPSSSPAQSAGKDHVTMTL